MSNQCIQINKKGQKMITFIDNLHKKYKVLSKLAQKQSQAFDSEVILLLVDQNQCVDQSLYQEVICNIGMDAFVLDVLEKSINRSPFTNQYELKKNLSTITDTLELQTKQLNKKMKVVERKENELNQRQNNIKNRIKEFTIQLEKQLTNKLLCKQAEIKKNISTLLNNVKAKQKIFCDRKQEINQKLTQLSNKQKSLTNMAAKQKQIVKKAQNSEVLNLQVETELTIKNTSNLNSKQLRELTKKNEDIKSELQKIRKKYKTTEMAYSKMKNQVALKEKENEILSEKIRQVTKQLQEEKNRMKQKQKQTIIENVKGKQEQSKISIKINAVRMGQKKSASLVVNTGKPNKGELIDMLQMLDISHIDPEYGRTSELKQNVESNFNFEMRQVNSKMVSISEINEDKSKGINEFNNAQAIYQTDMNIQNLQDILFCKGSNQNQIRQSIQRRGSQKFAAKMQPKVQYSQHANKNQESGYKWQQSDQQSLQLPQFLTATPKTQQSPNQILKMLQNKLQQQKNASQILIASGLLLKFIKVPFFEHSKKTLTQYFDLLLEHIQQSNPSYYQTVNYISKPEFVQFFQKCYLGYEANLEIAQATTLLLSRILMMTSIQVNFCCDFVSAIRLRAKISEKSTHIDQTENQQFLRANINCLLSMI